MDDIDRNSSAWRLCASIMKGASDEEIEKAVENLRSTLGLITEIGHRQAEEEKLKAQEEGRGYMPHSEQPCPTCGRKYGEAVRAFQRTPDPIRDACRVIVRTAATGASLLRFANSRQ